MRSSWTRVAVTGAAVLTLLGSVAGCSKGSSSTDEVAVAAPPTTAATSSTTTTATRQPCTVPNLTAAAAVDYPEPTLTDHACSSAAAVATVESTKIPGGTGVGFFVTGTDGAWKLLKIGNVDNAKTDAPTEIPATLVSAWRAAYDARVASENTTTTIFDASGGDMYEGEKVTTTTTAPPETTPPSDCPPDTPPDQCPTQEQPAP